MYTLFRFIHINRKLKLFRNDWRAGSFVNFRGVQKPIHLLQPKFDNSILTKEIKKKIELSQSFIFIKTSGSLEYLLTSELVL